MRTEEDLKEGISNSEKIMKTELGRLSATTPNIDMEIDFV